MMPAGLSRRDILKVGIGAAAAGVGTARTSAPKARAFRRGVNTWPWFSLTREYPPPHTDYAWPPYQENRAIPRPDDLARLAGAGFDFLRIPVDPGPILDAVGDHRAMLLAALFDAVRLARSAGLTVIVNLQPNEATHHYNSRAMIASLASPLFPAYRALAAEVAGGLAALGSAGLALECVNEPPQACVSDDWAAVQIALLSAARSAARDLTLVATGGCGSMVSGLEALDPGPLAGLGPLVFTFHFYEPYLFSHQGAPWMREPVYRSLNAVPWPASAGSLDRTLSAVRMRMSADAGRTPDEKRAAMDITRRLMEQYFEADPDERFIAGYLDRVAAWASAHGIARDAIVMGEFGAVKTTGPIVASGAADRVRYIRDVREGAEARGLGWAFWNLFDSMGLMDDRTRLLDPDVIGALGLRMAPR